MIIWKKVSNKNNILYVDKRIYATGGLIAQTGFHLMAVTWLVTVFFAVKAAIQKKIVQHRRWTIVNYSVTFAAVTLRVWLGGFMVVFGTTHYDVYYAYTAWLSWVPNILFILAYLQRKKSFDY